MELNGFDPKPSLVDMELAGADEEVTMETLGGGVSCDVFKVTTAKRTLCVKHALPKLRVEADWRAPAERSHAEVAWFKLVGGIERRWVPAVLGEDRSRHCFAMSWFPPETHPVWKGELAAGRADASFAAAVGEALARIHGETAGQDDIAHHFANAPQFHALRVEPYLLHTAAADPDVAQPLRAIAKALTATKIALMHGDVSPKNILKGPDGPVFLDAETCCYGDPAFDLAFCLNHLLLKALWHPAFATDYAVCFTALMNAYFARSHWEGRPGLERRTSALLAAFLLARVDGKSPVEYLTSERKKTFVRRMAKQFLVEGTGHLGEILARWTEALPSRQM